MTRDADIRALGELLERVVGGPDPGKSLAEALYDAGLRPSVEPLDVERLAEALKEYDAGRLRVPFAPSHVLSPDQSPSRFHRAWAKTLLDYAALPTQASDSPENREPVDLTCLGSPYPHDSADLKASCPECHP